ncbi:two-component system regulatory protein YycI [Polycladomyces subterraneus]|uniref:Two-component system regulatory protein YycI n=1 Tax=Polycladomyces subterraneus TaxID=1016997 RepID=A0ABT8IIK1_9BACL|nr:two-component system regulatory protein YycI [Polycladomyces subterraneus]MDN4592582.1 two-component system regulatory protein YycI [Polycladomyces subterraneus]
MDWNRAKTVLILAFLCLNAFLAVQLLEIQQERSQLLNVAQSTMNDLKQLLANKKIQLRRSIPEEQPTIPLLEAHLAQPGDGWERQDGVYIKQFFPSASRPSDLNQLLGREIENFSTYRTDMVLPQSGNRVYYQTWEGYPLFEGKVEANLENGRLKEIQWTPLSIRAEDTRQRVTPAYIALLNLIESGKVSAESRIPIIELGYHGQQYDAESMVLYPVWRVVVQDKNNQPHTYYVNAMTGAVESPD